MTKEPRSLAFAGMTELRRSFNKGDDGDAMNRVSTELLP